MTSSNTITLMDFRHGKVVEIDESIPPLSTSAEHDTETAAPQPAGAGVVFGSIGSPPRDQRG